MPHNGRNPGNGWTTSRDMDQSQMHPLQVVAESNQELKFNTLPPPHPHQERRLSPSNNMTEKGTENTISNSINSNSENERQLNETVTNNNIIISTGVMLVLLAPVSNSQPLLPVAPLLLPILMPLLDPILQVRLRPNNMSILGMLPEEVPISTCSNNSNIMGLMIEMTEMIGTERLTHPLLMVLILMLQIQVPVLGIPKPLPPQPMPKAQVEVERTKTGHHLLPPLHFGRLGKLLKVILLPTMWNY